MATDPVPIPTPENSYKAKKGFLGMFKKDKKDGAIDKSLQKVRSEEKNDIKEMQAYNKENNDDKQLSKEMSASFKKSSKNDFDLPDPETESHADKEIDMDDLEHLEKELDNDKEIEPPKLDKNEKLDEFELPDFDKTPDESMDEPPVEIKTEAAVEKAIDEIEKETSEEFSLSNQAALEPAEKPDEKVMSPITPDPSVPLVSQAQKIVEMSKVEPAKIRPRKGVEQYFKGLEQEHKKITETITKAIKSPEQELPPEHFFYLKNGKPVKSLQELIKALRVIDDETFKHHVNDTRNDFANWLRDILKKEDLADQVRSKKVKEELLKILTQHVKEIDESLLTHKREQLNLIERVRKARDELYQLQAELDGREKNISKRESTGRQVDREKTALDADKKAFEQKQNAFINERKKMLATEKQYKQQMENFQAQQSRLKAAETKFTAQLQDLQKRETAVKSKESTFEKKEAELAEREKEVNRKQTKIEEVLQANENLKKILDGMDTKMKEEKDRIEQQGFSEYVKEELAKMYPEHVNQVTNIDGSLDMLPAKQTDLYAQITDCRKLLEKNQLRDAQKKYNQIKQDFASRKMPPAEKEQIYNKLMELYDDIHLALMQ
jgi:hypothetical protein